MNSLNISEAKLMVMLTQAYQSGYNNCVAQQKTNVVVPIQVGSATSNEGKDLFVLPDSDGFTFGNCSREPYSYLEACSVINPIGLAEFLDRVSDVVNRNERPSIQEHIDSISEIHDILIDAFPDREGGPSFESKKLIEISRIVHRHFEPLDKTIEP